MSVIASDFFRQSPVLMMPVIALGLFCAAFLVIAIRALRARPDQLTELSRLPLEEDKYE